MRNMLQAIAALTLVGFGALGAGPPPARQALKMTGAVTTYTDFLQLPPGFSKRAFFELDMSQGSIGYSDATLESKKVGNEVRYDYTNVMAIRFGDGTRAEATVTAELSTQFVPYWAKTVRSTITPAGEIVDRTVSVTIKKDVVSIEDTSGKPPGLRNIPRGPAPFVMAMDAALELVDYKNRDSFMLYEFDPQSGKPELLGFKNEKRDDGTWSIKVGVPMGPRRYNIKIGADGKLLEWENIKGGLVIKRCSKERMEACKAQANMG